jgi:cytoskeletal protein CcmA (bactofilin family)
MLKDFVEKFKGSTATGSRDAEPTWGESSLSPALPPFSQPQPAPLSPRDTSNHSVLGPDVEIKGSIRFSNDLVIHGRVEGDVCSDGCLTVGTDSVIKGEIKTRSVILFGLMEGNITSQDRCELKSTATLVGDIVAGTLIIEEGAAFIGTSHVDKRQGKITKTPDHTSKPLEILHGTLEEETPAHPAVVIPIRQAA